MRTDRSPVIWEEKRRPAWFPVFLSLMIVLLTLMVLLVTFSETDPEKIRIFRQHAREYLFSGAKNANKLTEGKHPLRDLVNRMKSRGITRKLMESFLTRQQIMNIPIRDGEEGVVVVLPRMVTLKEGGEEKINRESRAYLQAILPLVSDLPVFVEFRGYQPPQEGLSAVELLRLSAEHALRVYRFFADRGVSPEKMVVTGFGGTFFESEPVEKVEVRFRETDY